MAPTRRTSVQAIRGLHPAIVLCLILLSVCAPAAAAPTEPTPTGSPSPPAGTASASPTPLEQEKLREEIRKLQIENDRAEGAVGWLLAIGPLITVLVAVGTLGWTFYKQSKDLTQAQRDAQDQAAQWRQDMARQQQAEAESAAQWRDEFRRQVEKDQEERATERLRRFDQNIASVVTSIGSTNQATRLNAAAALSFFVKADYSSLQCDLLNVLIANLKAAPEPAVADLLRQHLAKVLHLLFAPERELNPEVGSWIDLSRTDLYRVDLHGLDLRGKVVLDLAFARLKYANFHEAVLIRARGGDAVLDGAYFSRAHMDEARFNKARAVESPVKFHGARLVSATFVDAELPRAEFQQARLQGAHFTGADLRSARFEEADLADARFGGAAFDEAALRSIALGARRWRQALFDPATRAQLMEASGKDSSGR